jgi:ABC-2 type transport system permease protein
MYLGVLGFGSGRCSSAPARGATCSSWRPGVIGMTVLFTSMFSGIALLWDRQFGFLKETLVAPVPRLRSWRAHARRRDGRDDSGDCSCFVVSLIAGFRPRACSRCRSRSSFMALIAVVFAALGTAIGST